MYIEKLFNHDFLFDDFVLNADGSLSALGQDISIPPKELHVLITLLEDCGNVVPKDYIIDQVWGDYPVGDESLTRCIYALRRILRESKNNKFIETIYGRGYRFCKKVTKVPRLRGGAQAMKLAVFPFGGIDESQALQLHAKLLDALADIRFAGLSIVPAALTRESQRLDDVLSLCRQLALDYYLSGEFVLESGVTVLQLEWVEAARQQLVRRETLRREEGASWSQRLQAWADGVPALLSGASLAPASTSEVLVSHVMARRCLRGRQRSDLSSALEYLQMALAQDPCHVPSLVAMAETYLAMAMHGDIWPDSAFSQAGLALQKARQLAPDSAAALGVQGWLSSLSEDAHESASSLFRHAASLGNASAELHLYHAIQLSIAGDFAASHRALHTCIARDGRLAPAQLFKLWLLYVMGRTEEAVAFGLAQVTLGESSARFYGVLAVVLARAGQLADAERYAALTLEKAPTGLPEIVHHAMVQCWIEPQGARHLLWQLAEEARLRYRCPGLLAALALQLGERALVATLLRLAGQQRCVWLPFVRVSPQMAEFIRRSRQEDAL